MRFKVLREALLGTLSSVIGVVDKRQALPILSNILLSAGPNFLSIVGTDAEVELVGRMQVEDPDMVPGEITIPGKKLLDICRKLPEGAEIQIALEDRQAVITSGRGRYTLSTLSAKDFPTLEEGPSCLEFSLQQQSLKTLIEQTQFSMAQHDVRYYLNGLMLDIHLNEIRAVATDGHRLASSVLSADINTDPTQVILPRKGVQELMRLLDGNLGSIDVSVGDKHIRLTTDRFIFTSKLIDGRFPDYERVLPKNNNKTLKVGRAEFASMLQRVSVLANEKFQGVKLHLASDVLKASASNPENETAEEQMPVQYDGDEFTIGFNVNYLRDVLAILKNDTVLIRVSDSSNSALIYSEGDETHMYVIMPMRL